MKPILAALVLCVCVSALLIAAEPQSPPQSAAFLTIIANNGSGSQTGVKLVLLLKEVDESKESMTFSDGKTRLIITGTAEKADWDLNHKGRPYRASPNHNGPLFSLTSDESGSVLKVIKAFNISANSMNLPTAYIIQPGSYIFLKADLEDGQ